MTSPDNPKTGRVTPPVVYFTYDEERVEHIISDDKLMIIANGGKDVSLQICIGAFGVAFGYAQNLFKVVTDIKTSTPVEPWQGIGAAIFLAATAAFVLTAFYHQRTSIGVGNLIAQIRSRKVGVMGEPPFVGGEPFAGDPSISTETSSTTE